MLHNQVISPLLGQMLPDYKLNITDRQSGKPRVPRRETPEKAFALLEQIGLHYSSAEIKPTRMANLTSPAMS
jgi:hypothetical protein